MKKNLQEVDVCPEEPKPAKLKKQDDKYSTVFVSLPGI